MAIAMEGEKKEDDDGDNRGGRSRHRRWVEEKGGQPEYDNERRIRREEREALLDGGWRQR